MTKPKDMRPHELEAFIDEKLRQEGRDKRAALWSVTFPLAEAWQLHEAIIRKNGVLAQYGGKRKYVPLKFGRSYDVIRKAEKALQYKDSAEDALRWLDEGCAGFDSDCGWQGWQPKRVYGPEWFVEICEAFRLRHEPPPVKETKTTAQAQSAEQEQPEDHDGDETNDDAEVAEETTITNITSAKIRELESRLAASETHREQAHAYQVEEINDLDQRLMEAQERIRLLEAILTQHHIEIPLSQSLNDMLNSLDEDQPTPTEQKDEIKEEVRVEERPKKQWGGARPGAGRPKKAKVDGNETYQDALTEAALSGKLIENISVP